MLVQVHRLGQTKTVHVYRLVTEGTVEERMIERAEKSIEVEFFIVEDQLQLHVRILLDELRRPVRKPTLTEADRRRHAQLAGGRILAFG